MASLRRGSRGLGGGMPSRPSELEAPPLRPNTWRAECQFRSKKVRPPGFEPGTISLKGSCSTRLSYGRIILKLIETISFPPKEDPPLAEKGSYSAYAPNSAWATLGKKASDGQAYQTLLNFALQNLRGQAVRELL